jgi:hypothetical protein
MILFERAIELDERMQTPQKQKSLLYGQFERSCARKNQFLRFFRKLNHQVWIERKLCKQRNTTVQDLSSHLS